MKSIIALAFASALAVAAPMAAASSGSCKVPTGEPAKEDHSHCGMAASNDKSDAGEVHRATGSVKSVDKSTGKVTIAHDAIPSLKWPAMTMRFGVSDRKLLDELAAGKKIDFRFVQRGTDYVVTALY